MGLTSGIISLNCLEKTRNLTWVARFAFPECTLLMLGLWSKQRRHFRLDIRLEIILPQFKKNKNIYTFSKSLPYTLIYSLNIIWTASYFDIKHGYYFTEVWPSASITLHRQGCLWETLHAWLFKMKSHSNNCSIGDTLSELKLNKYRAINFHHKVI